MSIDDEISQEKLQEAADRLQELGILVCDHIYDIDMIVKEIMKLPAALKKEGKPELGLVVVDYIQFATGEGAQNRNLEIGKISRALKVLAKTLHVPVLALSQLNRKLEDRSDKRPQMADLRESGNLEQDADTIVFLYRDEVYNKEADNPKKGTAEIIVSKNRGGECATLETAWLGEKMKFKDLAWSDIEKDFGPIGPVKKPKNGSGDNIANGLANRFNGGN